MTGASPASRLHEVTPAGMIARAASPPADYCRPATLC